MGTTPSPWIDNRLQLSSKSPDDAFRELREFHAQAAGGAAPVEWNYITLAPHINDDKGLLGAQKGQMLQRFEHGAVAGLELADDSLPEDAEKNRPWLKEGMSRHHQAFFHGSDAYTVDAIGARHTWFKLATPRIESLRQAFIGSDSRMRIAYARERRRSSRRGTGSSRRHREQAALAEVGHRQRGSLVLRRSGGQGDPLPAQPRPDVHHRRQHDRQEHPARRPSRARRRAAAERRRPREPGHGAGSRRIPRRLAGCLARLPRTRPDRAGARAMARGVLYAERAAAPRAGSTARYRTSSPDWLAAETAGISEREARLTGMDRELAGVAGRLSKLDDDLAVAEQGLERCRSAAAELAAFSGRRRRGPSSRVPRLPELAGRRTVRGTSWQPA